MIWQSFKLVILAKFLTGDDSPHRQNRILPEDDSWRTQAVETGTTMLERLLQGHFPASTA